jgi:hypothetical protein
MNVRVISIWHSLAVHVMLHHNFLLYNRHKLKSHENRRLKWGFRWWTLKPQDKDLIRLILSECDGCLSFQTARTSIKANDSEILLCIYKAYKILRKNWVSQFLKSIYSNVSFTENYRRDSNKCVQLSLATDRDKSYHKIDSHIPHSWLACAALLQD